MSWFRVATEGATTDGRSITRQWIEQMAKNFHREKYGARVWMEHVRGLYADGPFAALGDVTAVKSEEIKDGPLAGKMGLYVQLDPTPELKEINANRQKVYTSIEVDTDFSDSGEAYLVGVAVTDSPASLGTDMLKFSAQQGKDSPLAHRKQRPENLFTAAVDLDLATLFTEADEPDSDAEKPSLLDSIKALFKRHTDKSKIDFSAFRSDLEKTLELFVERHNALESEMGSLAATLGDVTTEKSAGAHADLKTSLDDLKTRFEDLYNRLDNEPDNPARPAATGGDSVELTDC